MTQRGRGTLEVHRSRNPFFQTTYGMDIGINPDEEIPWDATRAEYHPEPEPEEPLEGAEGDEREYSSPAPSPAKVEKPDFSFLYARSSAVIGAKVKMAEGPMAALLERPSGAMSVKNKHLRREEGGRTEEKMKPNVERILESYNHEPKPEDPRYTTASNEYGKSKPSEATYVADRAAAPKGFQSLSTVSSLRTLA
jgi:hypothetical protein